MATNEELDQRFHAVNSFFACNADFARIPGSPIAYWISGRLRDVFQSGLTLEDVSPVRQGFQTGDNATFLRLWPEVSLAKTMTNASCKEDVFQSQKKWVPYNKGGLFRKWYGNNEVLVAFDEPNFNSLKTSGNCLPSRHLYFRDSITWSGISSAIFGARYSPPGFTFSADGACSFFTDGWKEIVLGMLNSKVSIKIMEFFAATIHFNVGNIRQIPLASPAEPDKQALIDGVFQMIEAARIDWDSFETSWNFQMLIVLQHKAATVRASQDAADAEFIARFKRVKQLEEENNRLVIEAYGLQDELSPDVPDEQITLHRPDTEEDIKRLLSYAIGCMMGRYSLDKPGLIYAHSGSQGFDPDQYKTFRADDDGIIPLLETDWGIRDDAANRIVEFIGVAWPKEHLEENLKYIADSLGLTKSEQPRETIRRYLATGFYKHHLSMYKKRPIYWLFSSGKQRAFQCLVYLHRYHEGTLARMRTEYVIPLQGQIAARIEQLEGDKAKATSTSHRNKLQKEQNELKKQQAELLTFEEKLKHAADQKISLDLDDGVKVNYAKFTHPKYGEILAEVKAICGSKEEE